MAIERDLWALMKGNLPHGFFKRLEDRLGAGFPDVFYTFSKASGWIELKHLDELPVRPTTIVRVDHFTAHQRDFLTAHHKAGGTNWFFMRAGQEFFLLKGWVAAELIGNVTAQHLRESAVYHSTRRVDWLRFWTYIAKGGR